MKTLNIEQQQEISEYGSIEKAMFALTEQFEINMSEHFAGLRDELPKTEDGYRKLDAAYIAVQKILDTFDQFVDNKESE